MMTLNRLSNHHLIHRANSLALILALSLTLILANGKSESEENNIRTLHIASTGNSCLLSLDESVYYLETHQTWLGNYSILYRIDDDKITRITTFSNYGYFAGVYDGKAVIKLVESSYTNYPTCIRYTLFNPKSGLQERMPECVTELLKCDSRVMLHGYGAFIIINLRGVLWSYDSHFDRLETIDGSPFEFVDFSRGFCFAMKNESSYYIYITENSIEVLKASSSFPYPKLWVTGTSRFFCFDGPPEDLRIEERDILINGIVSIIERPVENNSLLVLSADSQGDFLYIITRTSVKRYDLRLQAFDQLFDLQLKIHDNAYIVDIIMVQCKSLWDFGFLT